MYGIQVHICLIAELMKESPFLDHCGMHQMEYCSASRFLGLSKMINCMQKSALLNYCTWFQVLVVAFSVRILRTCTELALLRVIVK